jgi:hypothetical protein
MTPAWISPPALARGVALKHSRLTSNAPLPLSALIGALHGLCQRFWIVEGFPAGVVYRHGNASPAQRAGRRNSVAAIGTGARDEDFIAVFAWIVLRNAGPFSDVPFKIRLPL